MYKNLEPKWLEVCLQWTEDFYVLVYKELRVGQTVDTAIKDYGSREGYAEMFVLTLMVVSDFYAARRQQGRSWESEKENAKVELHKLFKLALGESDGKAIDHETNEVVGICLAPHCYNSKNGLSSAETKPKSKETQRSGGGGSSGPITWRELDAAQKIGAAAHLAGLGLAVAGAGVVAAAGSVV